MNCMDFSCHPPPGEILYCLLLLPSSSLMFMLATNVLMLKIHSNLIPAGIRKVSSIRQLNIHIQGYSSKWIWFQNHSKIHSSCFPEGAFALKKQVEQCPLCGGAPIIFSQVLEALCSAEHSLPVLRPLAIFWEISRGEASLQFCFLSNYSVSLP